VADQVVSGEVKGLILHEKGIHELLKNDPIYQRVVKAITSGKTKESQAAIDHVQTLVDNGDVDVVNQEEETLAYFMTNNPDTAAAQNILSKIKLWFKKTFGMKLTDQDVIQIVNDLVAKDKGVESTTGNVMNSLTSDRRARLDATYTAANANPEVKGAIIADVSSTDNPEYQSKVMSAPQTLYAAVWDASQGRPAALAAKGGDVTNTLKEKWLKWMPQSEVLRDAVNKGLTSFGKLQDLTDRTRAEAHTNIQEATDKTLQPAIDFQKKNPEEFEETRKLMVRATVDNVDMKQSRRFKNLSKEAQDVYTSVESYYKDQTSRYIGALQKQLDALVTDDSKKEELQTYINTFKNDNVYFPMQRFGKYRLDAVDKSGVKYVSFSDRKSELKEEERQLVAQGFTVTGTGNIAKYSSDAQKTMSEADYLKAERLVDSLGGSEIAKEALWKTFMQMAPSTALKDRMKKRRNIAGASTDLIRGLSTTMNLYRDIARRNNAVERASIFENAVQDMKDMDTDKKLKAEQVYEELAAREELAGKSRAGWSSGLSKANFVLNLGFNPSSAIINMTQNVIVGLPILGSKFGFTRSSAAMTKALTDSFAVIRGMKTGNSPLEGDEADAFNHWKKAGTFDATQANMHIQLSEGDSKNYNSLTDKAIEVSAWMFHNAELANRITAGLAAYRLAKDSGMEHKEAKEYSSKAILDIHFDYSEEGKSRWQRGDAGSVMLAFKSYPIKMAYFMTNNVKKMVRGESKEVKQEAYKQFFSTLAVTGMFGGAMALPMNSALMLVADMLSDDDDWDAHKAFSEWSTEVAGEEGGKILTNKMFFRIPDGGGSPEDWGDELFKSITGPIGSRVSSIPKGLELISDGKYAAGMEKMMPSIASNMSKAYLWGEAGKAVNAYDTMIEEDFDGKDAFWRAIGFSSTDYARSSKQVWTEKRIERGAKERKTRLLRNASMSFITGDAEDKREARIMIREYNRTEGRESPITQSTIRKRVKQLKEKLGE